MSEFNYLDTPFFIHITPINMKVTIKPDFLIRTIAGEHILIGAGEQIDFSHMLILNETSVFLIRRMQDSGTTSDEVLAQKLSEEYNVTYPEALTDTRELLLELEQMGVIIIKEE